jgi:MoaA/NifB/PqqE/SkfB family radical SAM enzyme
MNNKGNEDMAKNIKWDFTTKCNLRCIHCMVGIGAENGSFAKNTRRLSLDEKFAIVDNLVSADVRAITFLGGEPLTSRHIFPVAQYAVSNGISVTLVTNGTLLNDISVDKIIGAGIRAVTVSLDGASANTHDQIRGRGSFDKTVTNIRRLVSGVKKHHSSVQIKINHVVSKINFNDIDKMFDLAHELEVDELAFLALSDVGNALEHEGDLVLSAADLVSAAIAIGRKFNSIEKGEYPRITQQIAYPLVCDYIKHRYGIDMPNSNITTICCFASISLGYITPNGFLFPCDRIVPQKYQSILGAPVERKSLLENSFDEIWGCNYFSKTFELVMTEDTYKDFNPCNTCQYLTTRQCNPCPLGSMGEGLSLGPYRIASAYFASAQSGIPESDRGEAVNIGCAGENILSGMSTYRFDTDTLSDDEFNRISNAIPEMSADIRSVAKSDGTRVIFNPKKTEFCCLDPLKQYMLQLANGENNVREIAGQIEDVVDSVWARACLEGTRNLSSDAIKRRVAGCFKYLDEAGFVLLKAEHV